MGFNKVALQMAHSYPHLCFTNERMAAISAKVAFNEYFLQFIEAT
jgi:hypothetical protein